jgi:lipopolysaccharide transport protein LptA
VTAGLALALAALAAPTVANLPLAGGGQVTVSAKQFKYVFPKQQLEYTGDPVRFTRGDSHLSCNRLVAQLEKNGEVREATCEGNVRFDRADKLVTCEKATYQAAAQRLTCQGKPTIKSGAMTATGKSLVYDLEKDEVTMDEPAGGMPSADADALVQKFQSRREKRGGKK